MAREKNAHDNKLLANKKSMVSTRFVLGAFFWCVCFKFACFRLCFGAYFGVCIFMLLLLFTVYSYVTFTFYFGVSSSLSCVCMCSLLLRHSKRI